MGVRGRDQKGARGRHGPVADKRGQCGLWVWDPLME